jgi:hypothetical protein
MASYEKPAEAAANMWFIFCVVKTDIASYINKMVSDVRLTDVRYKPCNFVQKIWWYNSDVLYVDVCLCMDLSFTIFLTHPERLEKLLPFIVQGFTSKFSSRYRYLPEILTWYIWTCEVFKKTPIAQTFIWCTPLSDFCNENHVEKIRTYHVQK